MQNDKLLPCPFCGEEAEYFEKGNTHIGIKETMIKCKKCHTKQEHKWLRMKFEFERIEELTIEAWNTRKPMERIIERLEEEKIEGTGLMNIGHNVATSIAIAIVKEAMSNEG